MTEKTTPYIGSEGWHYLEGEEMKLWDNTLRDGLQEIEVGEIIQKIRNYYNTSCTIDGRPPSKVEMGEFLDSLEKAPIR